VIACGCGAHLEERLFPGGAPYLFAHAHNSSAVRLPVVETVKAHVGARESASQKNRFMMAHSLKKVRLPSSRRLKLYRKNHSFKVYHITAQFPHTSLKYSPFIPLINTFSSAQLNVRRMLPK
jgi:hypothetical protein